MTQSITAVFEAGLLRPTTPLDLTEGASVELLIITKDDTQDSPGQKAARKLAKIAASKSGHVGDPNTSRDHDKVLYGEQGAR